MRSESIFRIELSNLDEYAEEMSDIAWFGLRKLKEGYSNKQIHILKEFNAPNQFVRDISDGHIILGIKRGTSSLVGFVQYREYPKYVTLVKIFVHPYEHGKGYGTKLVSAIKKLNKPIQVEAALTKQAIRFYRKNGFIKISLREKYLKDSSFKVMIMNYKPDTIRIRVRKMDNYYIIALGDVLLQSIAPPPFKEDAWVKVEKAYAYLEESKRRGLVKPLAEYPFYDLERV